MRILFFGTPSFAVCALEALLESSHTLVGVVTQPPRPAGRLGKPQGSAVEEAARRHGLDLFQPESLTDAAFLQTLRELKAEAALVVAYGRIFPPPLLSLFPRGAWNLHASLLPKYRGAAPIQWALIRGETQTGLTVFRMDEQLDHGKILLQETLPVSQEETAMTLGSTLAGKGGPLLFKALGLIESGTPTLLPQEESQASFAPRLTKADGVIDWKEPSLPIHNRIRGVQPWPGALTGLEGRVLKILSAVPHPQRGDSNASPGTVVQADPKKGILVQTGLGQLEIRELKLSGGKALSASDFLRGHPLHAGIHLLAPPL
ncbi:MAG: methionyl-tRNA formyltransferase [Candidatus Omnitrophica bacterium]|nr:methionyl-tRNA formyltransferase [Candidatus Omnitrophota bacterium]